MRYFKKFLPDFEEDWQDGVGRQNEDLVWYSELKISFTIFSDFVHFCYILCVNFLFWDISKKFLTDFDENWQDGVEWQKKDFVQYSELKINFTIFSEFLKHFLLYIMC